jgi:hypothetical protein
MPDLTKVDKTTIIFYMIFFQLLGIGRSPYKAIFGTEPKLGIDKTGLPEDVTSLIYNEQQLATALNVRTDVFEEEETTDEESTVVSEENIVEKVRFRI